MNQHQLNQQLEALLAEQNEFSEADKAWMRQYEGSGGQGSKGATGEGVLYEFFTPEYIVDLMWQLAYHYGYKGGTVLEPAVATGRILEPAPDKSKCYGFEINPTSAKICHVLYPESHIHTGYFETAFLESPRFTRRLKNGLTWLEGYPFSLVIGNPPYGKYKNHYSSYFPNPVMKQIELFFIYYGLKLLKPGGLLVYLISSNFLRNGLSYQSEKEDIGALADLVDAYRLPPVFKSSQVPTDIIVLRKK